MSPIVLFCQIEMLGLFLPTFIWRLERHLVKDLFLGGNRYRSTYSCRSDNHNPGGGIAFPGGTQCKTIFSGRPTTERIVLAVGENQQ